MVLEPDGIRKVGMPPCTSILLDFGLDDHIKV